MMSTATTTKELKDMSIDELLAEAMKELQEIEDTIQELKKLM
jgi:hypothetical protein